MSIKNRKKATDVLLAAVLKIDKHCNADNVGRLKKQLNDLSDTEFDRFMKLIRDKEACIYIYLPNMDKHPSMEDVFKVADSVGVKLFKRIYIQDDVTGEYMLTPEEFFVAKTPIRRMEQFADHKINVPKGDTKTDPLTGQVAKGSDDRAAGITNPEIQSLATKGLYKTIHEVVSVRGGNIGAYNTGVKKQAEENGSVKLNEIDPSFKNRTVGVGQVLIESLHLENNLAEDN